MVITLHCFFEADMMHTVFVLEIDTCGTQEWTIPKFASHVAIWRGRESSSGHFVKMSKCNHRSQEAQVVAYSWRERVVAQ